MTTTTMMMMMKAIPRQPQIHQQQTDSAVKHKEGKAEQVVKGQHTKSIDDNPSKQKIFAESPSDLARNLCAAIIVAILAVWTRIAIFVPENQVPGAFTTMHDYRVPLFANVAYLLGLQLLKQWCKRYLWRKFDTKILLSTSMDIYNVFQVLLNSWMVYRLIEALVLNGHPFIGDMTIVSKGTALPLWVHYCDKYLEFLDTIFMVIRGKLEQVSFLHVYHHVTISWSWRVALQTIPGGDSYFGALLNSLVHVLMYSYYTLSAWKVTCPWKKYLTKAQMLQFVSVLVYTATSYCLQANEIGSRVKRAYLVQAIEMSSLFVLFFDFFLKKYRGRGGEGSSSSSSSIEKQEESIQELTGYMREVKMSPQSSVDESGSLSSESTIESKRQ